MPELAMAIYLQVGFEKWLRAMGRGLLLADVNVDIGHRAAFLGGAMFGQTWPGPALAKRA